MKLAAPRAPAIDIVARPQFDLVVIAIDIAVFGVVGHPATPGGHAVCVHLLSDIFLGKVRIKLLPALRHGTARAVHFHHPSVLDPPHLYAIEACHDLLRVLLLDVPGDQYVRL